MGAMEDLGIGDRLRFVGPCLVKGELFDLDHYPGLRHGDGRVIAELYALLDIGVLQDLDEFEGYTASQPRDSLYIRERVALTEPQGAEAWVYIYNTVPDARTRITSGDWRAHLNERANG